MQPRSPLQEQWPVYRQQGWSEPALPYLQATLLFILGVYLWELYLDLRQRRRLQQGARARQLPQELQDVVAELDSQPHPAAAFADKQDAKDADKNRDEASADKGAADGINTHEPLLPQIKTKFERSCEYGLSKSTFGFVEGAFSLVVQTLLVLVYGWMPFVWDLSHRLLQQWGLPTSEILVSLLFLGILMVQDTLLSLPFSLYSTFVIEAKHGFNKQTLGDFFLDKVKGILLSAVIGAPITSALIYIIRAGGPHFYIYVWGFLFTTSIFLLTIYPTWIAPLFNKYTPLEDGELKTMIEKLAGRINFPLTKVFVVDGSRRSAHSNAYFYGFFKNKRIVLFDTLFSQMQNNEVIAILGHELGHWKRWHTIQGFVITQVYLLVAFAVFAKMQYNEDLYRAFGFAPKASDLNSFPVLIGLVLFFQTIWNPIDRALSFAMNLLSRKNEYEADAFAHELGYNRDLKSALVKIHIENLGNLIPDKWYSAYHASHPSLVERLQALSKLARKSD